MCGKYSTGWRRWILIWPILSAGTTLIGCQSVPTLPEFPNEKPGIEITYPQPSCTWPLIAQGTLGSGESVYYLVGESALLQQDICRETEQANHDIAAANALALDHLQAAYNEVLDEGAAQRERAGYYLEDAEARRRDVWIELWAYKGLLALAAIAAIL